MWHFATFDFNSEAVKEPIENAMLSRSSIADCRDVLDFAREEIGQLVRAISDASIACPLLITGARYLKYQYLLVTVILLAAQIPHNIVQDCVSGSMDILTSRFTPDPKEEFIISDLLTVKETWVTSIESFLTARYDGVLSYLHGVGVTPKQTKRLRELLNTSKASATGRPRPEDLPREKGSAQ